MLLSLLCVGSSALAARPPAILFCQINANEGFELYSWSEGNTTWKFALRPGIMGQEKVSRKSALAVPALSLNALKQRLQAISTYEKVCWRVNPDEGLIRPPSVLVDGIVSLAKERGLDLALLDF